MTPPTPLDKRILLALQARLEEISTSNGYATDVAGVTYGSVPPTPDDPLPLLVFLDTAGEASEAMGGSDLIASVTIAGFVEWGADPFAILDLRADIKRAVFRDQDRDLGGLISGLSLARQSTVPREAGGKVIGCTVTVAIHYDEAFGRPDQAAA